MQVLHVENTKRIKNRSSAIILLQTKIGTERMVLMKLKKISNVVQANLIYGSIYDIIVQVESNSIDELKRIISKNIRHLHNVRSTLTLVVYNTEPKKNWHTS